MEDKNEWPLFGGLFSPSILGVLTPGTDFQASEGWLVEVYSGARAVVAAGAMAIAQPDSWVMALPGSIVLAANGADVGQMPGSEVIWVTNLPWGEVDGTVN